MSAYLLDPKSIKYLATTLTADGVRYWGDTRQECIESLSRDMARLNVMAVSARYGDEHDAEYIEQCVHASILGHYSTLDVRQYHKTLRCYLYQCSEGQCPEHPLFKALEAHVSAVEKKLLALITGDQRYEDKAWG